MLQVQYTGMTCQNFAASHKSYNNSRFMGSAIMERCSYVWTENKLL